MMSELTVRTKQPLCDVRVSQTAFQIIKTVVSERRQQVFFGAFVEFERIRTAGIARRMRHFVSRIFFPTKSKVDAVSIQVVENVM